MSIVKTKTRGDLNSRKETLIGPFKIYLATDRRDEDGKLIIEDYEDPETGLFKRRAELDKEPFLETVLFRRNRYTPAKEIERLQKMGAADYQYKDMPLHQTIEALSIVLVSWDLKNNGKPVPVTIKGIIDNEVDDEIIYAVISKYYEVVRPPLELSEKSQNTFSQKEPMEDALESTD